MLAGKKPAGDLRASWSQTCISVRVMSICPESTMLASPKTLLCVACMNPTDLTWAVWPEQYLQRWVVCYVNVADVAEKDQVIAACSSLLVAVSRGAATILKERKKWKNSTRLKPYIREQESQCHNTKYVNTVSKKCPTGSYIWSFLKSIWLSCR